MKPMKIIRYNGSFRYRQQKRKRIVKLTLALMAVLVLVGAAIFAVYAVRPQPRSVSSVSDAAVNCILKNGETAEITLSDGETCMLTLPPGVDIRDVTFTSSDSAVARVDSAGRTDGMSVGAATVTATAGAFKAECAVTVTKAPAVKKLNEVTTAYKANLDLLREHREVSRENLYSIVVNRRTNTVTVYTYDENGEYTVPVRAMICSCGTGGEDITPIGEFSIYFKEAWHPLFGNVYGQYVSGFDGSYLFHSVPYYTKNAADLEAEEFNKLGTNASQGCVRLMASDSYWIYKHCELNTPVKVIDADSSADPLGRPSGILIDTTAKSRWDPTDPSDDNPYKGKMPKISGAKDVTVKTGSGFDPMDGVKVTDICGNSIIDRMTLTGTVIADKPGVYYLTYSVTDDFSQTTTVTRTVTVE